MMCEEEGQQYQDCFGECIDYDYLFFQIMEGLQCYGFGLVYDYVLVQFYVVFDVCVGIVVDVVVVIGLGFDQ